MKWKITFTYKGYIAGIYYNNCDTAEGAISSAECHIVNDYTDVRAERADI